MLILVPILRLNNTHIQAYARRSCYDTSPTRLDSRDGDFDTDIRYRSIQRQFKTRLKK